MAYDTTQHGKFPDASCGAGSNFYTCNAGPTFWGCCKSNPCGTGICPENDLTGALVGSPVQSAYYLAGDTSATASPATSLVPGPSTAGNFTVATPTSTTTSETATGPSTNTRFIAGVAAAAGVVLALFVGWLVYYICFVRRSAKKNQDEFESRQSVLSVARDTEKNKDSRISYASGESSLISIFLQNHMLIRLLQLHPSTLLPIPTLIHTMLHLVQEVSGSHSIERGHRSFPEKPSGVSSKPPCHHP